MEKLNPDFSWGRPAETVDAGSVDNVADVTDAASVGFDKQQWLLVLPGPVPSPARPGEMQSHRSDCIIIRTGEGPIDDGSTVRSRRR